MKEKYYLIIKDTDWEWNGEDSIAVDRVTIEEYDSWEKVVEAKRRAYDDSLIIKGEIVEGKISSWG